MNHTNLNNFVPPPRIPLVRDWATYIPDRRPAFKTHSNRGQGLNALKGAGSYGPRNGILYHYENDGWIEKTRIDNSIIHSECERCGTPLKSSKTYDSKIRYYVDWQWDKNTLKLEATCGRKCSNVFQCKMMLENSSLDGTSGNP